MLRAVEAQTDTVCGEVEDDGFVNRLGGFVDEVELGKSLGFSLEASEDVVEGSTEDCMSRRCQHSRAGE